VTGHLPTVAQALHDARSLGIDRLDAHMVLAWILGRPRSWLVAHDDAALDRAQADTLRAAFARRAAGEPLAYVIGTKEFHGLTLQVDRAVLVPRPDTELLVDWALELLAGPLAARPRPRVADLGTGSGAIALAVKQAHPAASLVATDASAAALDVARANAARLGLELAFASGSWWGALRAQHFDLVLSNPPYIAEGDPHLPALRHEPISALTSGGDGLDALREIIAGAGERLESGGWLLLEHGHDQGAAVRERLETAGFEAVTTRRDLAGVERCTGGRQPG
jgi:release factor glutamine methyltransferase